MDTGKKEFQIWSLRDKEIDPKAFEADLRALAAERGLTDNDIDFEPEKTFPVEGAILILLGFASKVAYDIWKEFILPRLREKYGIREPSPAS